jgi:KTSC domain-containing protein
MRVLIIAATLAVAGMIVLISPLVPASAEEVCVKYHKCLDVDQFKCETITRSSFIKRVCYLQTKRYMIIKLKETYYHYCNMGPEINSEFLAAPSMGRYYNDNIRSKPDGTHGPFDCRDHPIPSL